MVSSKLESHNPKLLFTKRQLGRLDRIYKPMTGTSSVSESESDAGVNSSDTNQSCFTRSGMELSG
jgi:hypothetical protein